MTWFLPDDYKPPVTGKYMKFEDGVNRFRILGPAIVGQVFWTTTNDGAKRPVRRRMNEPVRQHELSANKHGEIELPKHFWAFPVWNYDAGNVQILEVTQSTVQRAIRALYQDRAWGDPSKYDIAVTRKGSGLDTEYTIMPSPPSPMPPEAAEAFNTERPNLEALFSGGDPFAHPVAAEPAPAAKPASTTVPVNTAEHGEATGVKIEEITKKGNAWVLVTPQGDFYTLDQRVYEAAANCLAQGYPADVIRWRRTERGNMLVTELIDIPI